MDKVLSLEAYTLLSVINMKLRNNYKSLADLCEDMNIDTQALESKLLSIGYIYQADNNQFISTEAV